MVAAFTGLDTERRAESDQLVVCATSMPVVLKPSRVESAGTPKAVAAAVDTLFVTGSSMKSEGTGTTPEPASAVTQVVACGVTPKEPTTTVSEIGKPLFATAAKMGWYCVCRSFSVWSAQSGWVDGQAKSLGPPKRSR